MNPPTGHGDMKRCVSVRQAWAAHHTMNDSRPRPSRSGRAVAETTREEGKEEMKRSVTKKQVKKRRVDGANEYH